MDSNPNLVAIKGFYNREKTKEGIVWNSGIDPIKRQMIITECKFCLESNVLCMKINATGVNFSAQCQKCINIFFDYGTFSDEEILLEKKNILKQIEEEIQKMKQDKQKKKEERKKIKLEMKQLEETKAAKNSATVIGPLD